MICIRGGSIHDAVRPQAYVADLLIDEGKIKAIGKDLAVPEGCQIVDGKGYDVYPGFIDAHTHIGLDGYGIGFEGRDYNEMNDICCPQLRAIDGINPMDPTFRSAREAGVTTVCTGPGSANVLGGTFTAIKTVGRRIDDMIIKAEVAMKCAFGENPKRCYQSKCDSTRMSTAAILRNALANAKDYKARRDAAGDDPAKLPKYDQKNGSAASRAGKENPLEGSRPSGQRSLHRPAHCPGI